MSSLSWKTTFVASSRLLRVLGSGLFLHHASRRGFPHRGTGGSGASAPANLRKLTIPADTGRYPPQFRPDKILGSVSSAPPPVVLSLPKTLSTAETHRICDIGWASPSRRSPSTALPSSEYSAASGTSAASLLDTTSSPKISSPPSARVFKSVSQCRIE